MSGEEAQVYASTSANSSVWMTSGRIWIDLGELRRIVAAAEGMGGEAAVVVSDVTNRTTGDGYFFKRIDIHDSKQMARRVVDLQVVEP